MLDANELKSAFTSMHIRITHDEINCLLIEYDITGRGEKLSLKELEEDFDTYKTDKEKLDRDPQERDKWRMGIKIDKTEQRWVRKGNGHREGYEGRNDFNNNRYDKGGRDAFMNDRDNHWNNNYRNDRKP